jgi:signal peptidase II
LIVTIVAIDVVTKYIAQTTLIPYRMPRQVVGEWVRFTLVFNQGAAFGLHLGPWSRQIFLVLTVVALIILGRLYKDTRPGDRVRLIALGLVCGGAIGNLLDRIRSSVGVVDFLDIGVGNWRWPTFNVADIAVTTGAILLAWALWGEEREETEGREQRAENGDLQDTGGMVQGSGTASESSSPRASGDPSSAG